MTKFRISKNVSVRGLTGACDVGNSHEKCLKPKGLLKAPGAHTLCFLFGLPVLKKIQTHPTLFWFREYDELINVQPRALVNSFHNRYHYIFVFRYEVMNYLNKCASVIVETMKLHSITEEKATFCYTLLKLLNIGSSFQPLFSCELITLFARILHEFAIVKILFIAAWWISPNFVYINTSIYSYIIRWGLWSIPGFGWSNSQQS